MGFSPSFNDVLTAFGNKVGIPDLEISESNQCCLGFDDVELNFELSSNGEKIIISSPVTSSNQKPSDQLLMRYFAINHLMMLDGIGGLGFNEFEQNLVFFATVPLRGLDDSYFEAQITDYVNRIEQMKEMFGSDTWNAIGNDSSIKNSDLVSQLRLVNT